LCFLTDFEWHSPTLATGRTLLRCHSFLKLAGQDIYATDRWRPVAMKRPVSNIAKFYTWSCLSGINLLYPIQAIYLLGKGFTAPQLALFASMTALCSTLLELPTGYVADRFSRKVSVALGFLCASIAYVGLAFVQTLCGLFFVSLFLGLNNALKSGAAESLIFDELKRLKQEADYLHITSRGSVFTQIAAAGASFTGPLLFAANVTLPFLVNATVNLFLTFFVLTFKETTVPQEGAQQLNLFDGIRKVVNVKPIRIITCIDMLLLVFVNIFYQVLYFPKLNQLGVPVQYLGLLDVMTLICMTGMLLILPSMVFNKGWANLLVYTLTTVGIFIVFGITMRLLVAIVFGALFDLAWTARKHIVGALTNTYLASQDRALSLSSMSFLSNTVAALLVPLMMYLLTMNFLFSCIPAALIVGLLILYGYTQQTDR
jgi:MFS family permease